MTNIQISSNAAPLRRPVLAHKLVGLFTRSAAMGLLDGPTVTELDPASLRRLVTALQQHDIARGAGTTLSPLMQDGTAEIDDAASLAIEDQIDQVTEALEASAAPQAEWPAMRVVFGDAVLAGLLEVAPISIRRYASGERQPPAVVVARLHWLAMIVSDLAGAYNDFGMRRWFERPRSQLGGASPRAFLGADWDVDGERAARVRQLAAAVSGAQPLAV